MTRAKHRLINEKYWHRTNRYQSRQNREERSAKQKQWNLQYRYGLKDNYKPAQCCMICERTDKLLYVDHNHLTNVPRGWLCNGCNVKLGWFEKRKERINQYLAFAD